MVRHPRRGRVRLVTPHTRVARRCASIRHRRTPRGVSIVALAVLAVAALAGCRSAPTGATAPRGFRSEASLALALAAGRIPLVDTDPEVPADVTATRDLVYRSVGGRDLALDLYRPAVVRPAAAPAAAGARPDTPAPGAAEAAPGSPQDGSGRLPLIVFVHGGSWRGGDRDDYRRYLVDYAAKGYATATVSYRFAPDDPYPAALDDVRCAVAWLAGRADDLRIDPDRIALVGGSAGAHLAMLVAYAAADETGSATIAGGACDVPYTIRAVVNFYGPSDLTTDFARDHPTVTDFLGAQFDADPHRFTAASPRSHVTGDDPPTLIFHGTIDTVVPVDQSDSLAARLAEVGVPVIYHRLDGWPHTMDAAAAVNRFAQTAMDAFFAAHL